MFKICCDRCGADIPSQNEESKYIVFRRPMDGLIHLGYPGNRVDLCDNCSELLQHTIDRTMSSKQEAVRDVIRTLDVVKENYPDTKICVEIPGNVAECRLGDALVFTTTEYDRIAVDSE